MVNVVFIVAKNVKILVKYMVNIGIVYQTLNFIFKMKQDITQKN